jgi:hypothetical protein
MKRLLNFDLTHLPVALTSYSLPPFNPPSSLPLTSPLIPSLKLEFQILCSHLSNLHSLLHSLHLYLAYAHPFLPATLYNKLNTQASILLDEFCTVSDLITPEEVHAHYDNLVGTVGLMLDRAKEMLGDGEMEDGIREGMLEVLREGQDQKLSFVVQGKKRGRKRRKKEEENVKVGIRMSNGEVGKYRMKVCERVGELKRKIMQQEGIQFDNMRLYFHFKELNDQKSLNDYQIKNNDILKLTVKTIAKENTIEIFTDDGVKYMVRWKTDEPISQVKNRVNSIFWANVIDKNLVLNGRVLNENRTLKFYGYNIGDILYLEDSKISIHVQFVNDFVNLMVKPNETISDLKEKLIEKEMIESKHWKLYFDGIELRWNYKTLKQYNIQHNSKIYAF